MSEVEEEAIKTEIKEYVLGCRTINPTITFFTYTVISKKSLSDISCNTNTLFRIFSTPSSIDIARKIELYFIDLGVKTDPTVVNEDTRIYLYKMS